MRLKPSDIEDLTTAVKYFLKAGELATLYLYGSRTKDHLKGGDIDLLLLVESASAEQRLNAELWAIVSLMKKQVGDQRIDLIIARREQVDSDPFLKVIFPEALKIKHFA